MPSLIHIRLVNDHPLSTKLFTPFLVTVNLTLNGWKSDQSICKTDFQSLRQIAVAFGTESTGKKGSGWKDG
jgi:hypothetical protein